MSNRYGGGVLIATNSGHFTEGLIFHELGHAFGLHHKPEQKIGLNPLTEMRFLTMAITSVFRPAVILKECFVNFYSKAHNYLYRLLGEVRKPRQREPCGIR